ncbi:error-prone DNA polymerase [Corynebacterium sp. HS2168-gen11]|uniref:error-prone DNA polymerase n=1 Tax=Corynebacterium sp. HS2168-gen11 TaxID=2974027 RepID=UPI0037C048BA
MGPSQDSLDGTYIRFYSSPLGGELHGCSYYHFLHGASSPEQMVIAAKQSGLEYLCLQDRDGFYGATEFAEAAREHDISPVWGAELSLDYAVLSCICKNPHGYQRLSALISHAHMTGTADTVVYPSLKEIAQWLDDSCYILVHHQWIPRLAELIDAFGRHNIVLEYVVSFLPDDADQYRNLDAARAKFGTDIQFIITAQPEAATVADGPIAQLKQSLARRETVSESYTQLHPAGARWVRTVSEMAAVLPKHLHQGFQTAQQLAQACSFPLKLVSANLPKWQTPPGHDENSWLAKCVWQRFPKRYRSRDAATAAQARAQITHELAVIQELGFAGYFLIVMDLVDYAKRNNILCQGRGSAANSTVCFTLGITNVEPITAGLLFERFLSVDREGPPDIDIDFESGRREEVIQYVFATYGRNNAAQVANVITYQRKGAVRDIGRVLGFPQGIIDQWSRGVQAPPSYVEDLAQRLLEHPRHLGIHAGGMVICDRPLADVVPIQWARKQRRSIVQWDKEGCATAGLVKFDLLGLGMLEALHVMVDLVAKHYGVTIQLWDLDMRDPGVYRMLSAGDSVGVFQVESRAQMSMLPRLRPQCFFDLVVEVALVRPGPIQGESVHPYLRRRNGEEPITYEHPVLEKALGKTLGIPLFQEQLMQIAVDAAGLTAGEADQLRRAMGAKRSEERMQRLKQRFYQGLQTTNGIQGAAADSLWQKILAFATYGFPESHAQSFAAIVYFSAWMKYHYPLAFYVGLLRCQPMGFYSPQSLLADARRHGISILPVDIAASQVATTIEGDAIRLGFHHIQGLAHPEKLEVDTPFRDMADVARRTGFGVHQLEILAKAGVFRSWGLNHRQALWQAGIAATEQPDMLPGLSMVQSPPLPGLSLQELIAAELHSTGVTHDRHPMSIWRESFTTRQVVPADQLRIQEDGKRICVAGIVTHRQRPSSAHNVVFLSLEDETGLINIVVKAPVWQKYKGCANTAPALIVRGIIQNRTGAAAVIADRIEILENVAAIATHARNYR